MPAAISAAVAVQYLAGASAGDGAATQSWRGLGKDATVKKKKGRFSVTDDVATEDALGVEGMESVLQIARHPPKPSRSKQNQEQKTQRQRQEKIRRVCQTRIAAEPIAATRA